MTTFGRNPLDGHDDRVVAAIWSEIERVPDIMDSLALDMELRSKRDIINECVANAQEALSSGGLPSSADETIRRVFAERTRRPVWPPANGYVLAARAFFAEVGEEIAKHDALTRNLLDIAEEMRDGGHDEDNVIVSQCREVLALAENAQLPPDLGERVREAWSRCHQGPKPDYAAEEAARAAVGVAGGGLNGFERIEQVEASRTILPERGVGVTVRHAEGTPDPDAHVLDPKALRTSRAFPAI